MKRLALFAASAALAVCAAIYSSPVSAADAPAAKGGLKNEICPLSGKPTVADRFIAYDDADKKVHARIYVCCEKCEKAGASMNGKELYEKAYLTGKDGKKSEYGKTVADLNNKICPGTGEKVKGKEFINYNGVKIGICCAGCDEDFLKDPDKTLSSTLKADVDALAAARKKAAEAK